MVNQGDGAVNVFLGSGQSLVVGGARFDVRAEADPQNPQILRLSLESTGGARVPIDLSALGGGSIPAHAAAQTASVENAQNALGRIARVIADQFNTQHALGVDLAGDMGGQFFSVGAPSVHSSAANTGGASMTATIADATALKASDYQVTRTSVGYSVRRMSDDTVTTYASLPQTVDGVTLVVSGVAAVNDSFVIQPVRDAVAGMAVRVSDPAKIAAGAPVRSASRLGNLGSGTIAAPSVVGPTANTNLRQPVTITFTSASQFDVSGTGTGNPTGVAYVDGGVVTYNGWTTQLTGSPKAGDVFTIQSNTTPTGDNRNAKALAAFGTRPIVDGASIASAYGQALSALGNATREASLSRDGLKTLQESAQLAEASVSGVNLDEEAADLLRYQQAYQAAAKYMQIVGSVFNELVALGR